MYLKQSWGWRVVKNLLVRKFHFSLSGAWNNPLVDSNPKHHLHIHHSCHSHMRMFWGKVGLFIMAMWTFNMLASICSSMELVNWTKIFFKWVSSLKNGYFLLTWHIAHNANIKCMTMVGVRFGIQHLLAWLGFQVPPTLLCVIFLLLLGP